MAHVSCVPYMSIECHVFHVPHMSHRPQGPCVPIVPPCVPCGSLAQSCPITQPLSTRQADGNQGHGEVRTCRDAVKPPPGLLGTVGHDD